MFNHMILPVRQQRFRAGHLSGGFPFATFQLFMRNTRPVMKSTGPGSRGNLFDPFDTLIFHEFAAEITFRNESEIFIELSQFCVQCFLDRVGITLTLQQLLLAVDDRFTFGNLESHTNLMDTISNRLELGRLVDNVFWCGDLSTVMQPRTDMQFVPFLFRKIEMGKSITGVPTRRFGQHLGQLRHPLTMPTGIR